LVVKSPQGFHCHRPVAHDFERAVDDEDGPITVGKIESLHRLVVELWRHPVLFRRHVGKTNGIGPGVRPVDVKPAFDQRDKMAPRTAGQFERFTALFTDSAFKEIDLLSRIVVGRVHAFSRKAAVPVAESVS